MDMIGNHVLTFVKNGLVGFGEIIDDVLHPRVSCFNHLASIDISLTDIIMRIDQSQVLLQVFGSQSDVSANVYVAASRGPRGIDIGIFAS